MTITLSNITNVLRVIAEPTRLRVLALCRAGELSVSEICDALGQSQPRVSRHLKLMVDAGILERVPEGNTVFHRLSGSALGSIVAKQILPLIPENDDVLDMDISRLAKIKQARAERAHQYFAENAGKWGQLRALHIDEQDVEHAILDMLSSKPLGDLLDMGTGTGRILEVLGPTADQSFGIDTSRAMLSIARSNLDKSNIPNCSVRQGDMHQLPFVQSSFDTVVIHQVLHFVEEHAFAIEQAARVLRPGGRLLIVDFAPHNVEELRTLHAHYRLGFPDEEVNTWIDQAGLTLSSVRNLEGDPLTVRLWLAEKPEISHAAHQPLP